jgi:glycosyltransferase involved in cell wall biosynthesis
VHEVIVVDSGEEQLLTEDYSELKNITVQYLITEKSVCIQRNLGINKASSPWIFLCDDGIEMPADYLKISRAYKTTPETGAISGLILQKEQDKWVSQYAERSVSKLFWKYFFI